MKQILADIYTWSWFSTEKGWDFNSHIICKGNEKVLIDPVIATPSDEKEIERLAPYQGLIITNRDHTRESLKWKERLQVPIFMHALDAPLIDLKVDHEFQDGDLLPCHLKVIHIPHNKSPGESALYLESEGILILGDALVGKPDGGLTLMPPEKYADIGKARTGIRVLEHLDLKAILVGDGVSILNNPAQAIRSFISQI